MTATMTAVEKMYAMHRVWVEQKAVVDRECRTLDAAAALMRKWNESRLVDAVGREAKSRAIKILGM